MYLLRKCVKAEAVRAEWEMSMMALSPLRHQWLPSLQRSLEHSETSRQHCWVQPEINTELVALPKSWRAGACCPTLRQVWSHTRIFYHSQLGAWEHSKQRWKKDRETHTHSEASLCCASLSRFGLQLCTFSKCWLAPWLLSLPLQGQEAFCGYT